MLGRRGLSYVVGVLLVLGVTLGAVVVFTQILSFQSGVLTSLQVADNSQQILGTVATGSIT
jgi:predicted aconitase with swiveling domain